MLIDRGNKQGALRPNEQITDNRTINETVDVYHLTDTGLRSTESRLHKKAEAKMPKETKNQAGTLPISSHSWVGRGSIASEQWYQ